MNGTRPFLFAVLLLLPCIGQAAEPAASPAPVPAVSAEGRDDGLTTLLIDRFSEEQQGPGWEARKRKLIAYAASVRTGNEVSLREFRGGAGPASKAIGEDKAGMVFHMLKKFVGEEQFAAAHKEFISLAKFRRVGWDDVRTLFEQQAGKDLGWFFRQWVDEKGLPDVRIEKAAARRNGGRFEVSFDAVQKGKSYTLDLPVSVLFARGGVKRETVAIDSEKKAVSILVDEEPLKITVDEEYDVARRLTPPETPPVIAALLEAEKPVIVPPASHRESYRPVIEAFTKQGAEEKEGGTLKDAEIRSSSLVVLGEDNPVVARLFGALPFPAAGFSAAVKKNPWDPEKVVGIFQARSAEEAETGFRQLRSLGDASSVSVEQGKVLSRKTESSSRGIQMELREETTAVDISALKTLTSVIEAATGKSIVYVGEYHDRFSHHNVELEVVEALHRKDPKVAVGMEMFQRPFQKALDGYIAGSLNEREFLKQSEYFKRWGFDYNLYKPILDFCRAGKVPVVALNQRREITDKVAKGGMDSLTPDEKKELPAQMDFSDDEYRKRLKDVFEEHKSSAELQFDFFYQAQIIWDETMAQSIDEFLWKNPGVRMAVIAGGGHLAHGSGIPKRVFRRNGQEYSIIINDGDIERGVADYVVFPPTLDGVTAPKLMVALKEADGKVVIAGFAKESPAEKAGLKAGDVILALDGEPIKDVGDMKIILYFKKSGDAVTVKAVRKRFLFGDKEMTFDIKL